MNTCEYNCFILTCPNCNNPENIACSIRDCFRSDFCVHYIINSDKCCFLLQIDIKMTLSDFSKKFKSLHHSVSFGVEPLNFLENEILLNNTNHLYFCHIPEPLRNLDNFNRFVSIFCPNKKDLTQISITVEANGDGIFYYDLFTINAFIKARIITFAPLIKFGDSKKDSLLCSFDPFKLPIILIYDINSITNTNILGKYMKEKIFQDNSNFETIVLTGNYKCNTKRMVLVFETHGDAVNALKTLKNRQQFPIPAQFSWFLNKQRLSIVELNRINMIKKNKNDTYSYLNRIRDQIDEQVFQMSNDYIIFKDYENAIKFKECRKTKNMSFANCNIVLLKSMISYDKKEDIIEFLGNNPQIEVLRVVEIDKKKMADFLTDQNLKDCYTNGYGMPSSFAVFFKGGKKHLKDFLGMNIYKDNTKLLLANEFCESDKNIFKKNKFFYYSFSENLLTINEIKNFGIIRFYFESINKVVVGFEDKVDELSKKEFKKPLNEIVKREININVLKFIPPKPDSNSKTTEPRRIFVAKVDRVEIYFTPPKVKSNANNLLKRQHKVKKSNIIEITNKQLDDIRKWIITHKELATIGSGASSSVYKFPANLCNSEEFGEFIVLKCIQKENYYRFAQKEFEILSQLSHPYVIKTFGKRINSANSSSNILSSNGQQFLESFVVLEYLPTDLKKAIKNTINPLTTTERTNIIEEIATAMEYLHSKGIMHRDLKPENIFLTKDKHVKVADFGISRSQDVKSTFTKGIGTLMYMSPELINGDNYDNSVDVYSFGIVVLDIATLSSSKKIFSEKFKLSQKDKNVTVFEESIENNKKLTPSAKWLIKKCVAYNPSNRPSFKDVINFLKINRDLIK